MSDIEEANSLFSYDPESGRLYWKINMNSRVRIGSIAGTIRKSGRTAYCYVRVNGRIHMAHRIAWHIHNGCFPNGEIDHIDGDGLNNRIDNLRDVTKSVNNRNQRMRIDNTSGFNGVCWHKRDEKWYAKINTNGKRKHIGGFNDLEEAAKVYRKAAAELGYTVRHGVCV